MKKALVGIIMGSDSDLSVMSEAKEVLDSFRVPNEITIVSAHRTTRRMLDYATHAKKMELRSSLQEQEELLICPAWSRL